MSLFEKLIEFKHVDLMTDDLHDLYNMLAHHEFYGLYKFELDNRLLIFAEMWNSGTGSDSEPERDIITLLATNYEFTVVIEINTYPYITIDSKINPNNFKQTCYVFSHDEALDIGLTEKYFKASYIATYRDLYGYQRRITDSFTIGMLLPRTAKSSRNS